MDRVEALVSATSEPAADVLSEILRGIRLEGTARTRCELLEPWGPEAAISPAAEFHLIVAGSGWLQWAGARTPRQFEAGDLVVFPHGDAHALFSPHDAARTPAAEVLRGRKLDDFGSAVLGGEGKRTEIICGFFRVRSARPHPLIQALPGLIHLRHRDTRDTLWLRSVANLLTHEINAVQQGTHAAIDRLVEILFIYAVRAYASTSRPAQGFLAALSDHHIGRALNLMQARLSEPWTLESLAREVALSRAAFAGRFQRLVREAPMSYLARQRMERAYELLTTTGLSVAQVAGHVGYASEAAFARAFKKTTGRGPGEARRGAMEAA